MEKDLEEDILYTNEEKLGYILKKLNLSTNDIAQKLEISAALVSQIQNPYNGKLKRVHLFALCHAYDIPVDIFENEMINKPEQIDRLLKHASFKVFQKEYALLEKLVGEWYFYSYPSNTNIADLWETQTFIYEDRTVEDMHKNRGKLFTGTKQSLIIKESHNSKNMTITVFDNDRVTYGVFPFSRIAKSNSFHREILSFGFISKEKTTKEKAKEILGKIEKNQLLIDYTLVERISASIAVKG